MLRIAEQMLSWAENYSCRLECAVRVLYECRASVINFTLQETNHSRAATESCLIIRYSGVLWQTPGKLGLHLLQGLRGNKINVVKPSIYNYAYIITHSLWLLNIHIWYPYYIYTHPYKCVSGQCWMIIFLRWSSCEKNPKCSARSTSRQQQQQVTGLRQRIITSLHKNHLTFISVSTIFIIRPRSLYNQIYLLLLWSRVTILHLRSFIHCQCWQESNERMHSSASKSSIRRFVITEKAPIKTLC